MLQIVTAPIYNKVNKVKRLLTFIKNGYKLKHTKSKEE